MRPFRFGTRFLQALMGCLTLRDECCLLRARYLFLIPIKDLSLHLDWYVCGLDVMETVQSFYEELATADVVVMSCGWMSWAYVISLSVPISHSSSAPTACCYDELREFCSETMPPLPYWCVRAYEHSSNSLLQHLFAIQHRLSWWLHYLPGTIMASVLVNLFPLLT